MKESTKLKLAEAQKYCDDNDKSTEFMLQYMQDFANVSHDCVISYLIKFGGFKEKNEIYNHTLDTSLSCDVV